MKSKKNLLIFAILLFSTIFIFLLKNEKGISIQNDPIEKIKPNKNKIITAQNEPSILPEKEPDSAEPKIKQIEAPIIEGIKARTAPITQQNELYTEELVSEREKIASLAPILVRPKLPFIKWEMQFSGSVAGAIAVKDKNLYFGTYDFQAFILNSDTGEVLSQIKTVSQPINSTKLYKDFFLVPQRNGQVTAYSTLDGKEKWNHRSAVDKSKGDIDLSISGINVIANRFYVSKHWGNLYIVNADTGILEKDVGVTYESRINLPAIKTEDGILFSNIAGELHCFKDDGTENWHYTIPKGYPLAMYLLNDTLFILNTEKELMALKLKDRTIKWSIQLAGFGFDSITIKNNLLYIQAKDLYIINPSNGKIIWQINAKSDEGFCRGAPVFINDTIFAAEQNGRLIKANLKDSKILFEYNSNEIIRSPITIDDEFLFLATTKKKIYAIDSITFK